MPDQRDNGNDPAHRWTRRRLRPDMHEAVRIEAARQHTTSSALIRRWVTERVESVDRVDLPSAVAAFQRDVETLAALVIPAPRDR